MTPLRPASHYLECANSSVETTTSEICREAEPLGVSTLEAMRGVGVRIPFQDLEGQFRARLRLPITRRTKYTGGLPGLTRLCASARLNQGAPNLVSRTGVAAVGIVCRLRGAESADREGWVAQAR